MRPQLSYRKPSNVCVRVNASRRVALGSAGSLVLTGVAVRPSEAKTPEADVALRRAESKKQLITRKPAIRKVPSVALADNLNISAVVKGCWQLDGAHRGAPETDQTSGSDAVDVFGTFVRAGITTFDTADLYGPSELVIGQYLRMHPETAGRVQVLTKMTFVEGDQDSLSADLVKYRLSGSMVRLGLDQVDLLQLAWEPSFSRRYLDVAKYLADLQARGVIRHLGLSNFPVPAMLNVLDAGVPIVSNQVPYSLLDRRAELYMREAASSRGVKLLARGTLAGGLIADAFRDQPASAVVIDTVSKKMYAPIISHLGGWVWFQDLLQALHTVGVRHGVSGSTVALKWVMQQPGITAAIVGARNRLHVSDYQRLWSFELDDVDLLDLEAACQGALQPTNDIGVWEQGGEW